MGRAVVPLPCPTWQIKYEDNDSKKRPLFSWVVYIARTKEEADEIVEKILAIRRHRGQRYSFSAQRPRGQSQNSFGARTAGSGI